MADSPFCKECLKNGKISHTYKLAKRPSFKCGTCKNVSEVGTYDQKDFEWRAKPESFIENVSKLFKSMGFKEQKDEFERIRSVSKV